MQQRGYSDFNSLKLPTRFHEDPQKEMTTKAPPRRSNSEVGLGKATREQQRHRQAPNEVCSEVEAS